MKRMNSVGCWNCLGLWADVMGMNGEREERGREVVEDED